MEEIPVNAADSSHVRPLSKIFMLLEISRGSTTVRGSTVVKVLCYNSEGRWFDPSWCQWIFH